MGPDTDNEDMEDVILDDKRERHWRKFSDNNDGGVDNQKAILHAKMWDLYMSKKEALY